MTCPVCNNKTKVIDSRPEVDCINRRRECARCGFRFNTVELDEDMLEKLIKQAQIENTGVLGNITLSLIRSALKGW